MTLIFRWVINAVALLLVAYLIPGFAVASLYSALIAALVLGFINAVIRPILIVLTLPVSIMTLGLFIFVINAGLIWFMGTVVQGVSVDGFIPAFIAALLLWVVSLATSQLIKSSSHS